MHRYSIYRTPVAPATLLHSTLLIAAIAIIGSAINIDAFVIAPRTSSLQRHSSSLLHSENSATGTFNGSTILDRITINDKIIVRDTTAEERGKGGVQVVAAGDSGGSGDAVSIKALEVVARIPRELVISPVDMPPRAWDSVSKGRNLTWATELTAAALAVLHPTEEEMDGLTVQTKKEWVQSWKTGGWGSTSDLGPDIAADLVGPSLLTTGTDNDHNIYAKFRMPCHPTNFKAALGLKLLTKCSDEDAIKAMATRGFTYRSMRDALNELVFMPTERVNKGTLKDKRCWDVADTFDRVISRATTLELENTDNTISPSHAIVPIHELLSHSLNENTRLVSVPDEVLLVATRDIEPGEPITRNYVLDAPRLKCDDESLKGTALDLLLQFGLPPSAWPQ